MSVLFRFALLVSTVLAPHRFLNAADAPASQAGPNSDPTYQQLRNLTLAGEAVSVSNFNLKRDAGTFHLRSGTVCFVTPVSGRVTGALFTGDGNFILDPQVESERRSLKLLTKENEFSENFSQAVFRFTEHAEHDAPQIQRQSGSAPTGGCFKPGARRVLSRLYSRQTIQRQRALRNRP